MIIKDEIHGNIEFDELETKIIDTKEFQRLRKIKQMAFTYLVYPGANHTRFEHSIGVMQLATRVCEKLGFDDEKTKKIRLFALLHDIGHIAFSHELEKVSKPFLGAHEQIGDKKILNGELKDVIGENYDPKEIAGMEKTVEGRIVSSDLGVDRMDYLVRDAQNTGVAYGVIDIDRIIHTLELRKNELMINEGGLEAAESLLIARFMMFSTVYLHKTVRIAAAMFQRGFENAVREKEVKPEQFLSAGDEEALLILGRTKNAGTYVERLVARNLYKEAYYVDSEKFAKISNRIREYEKEISKKASCDVILEYPSGFFKPVDFKIAPDDGTEPKPISELSDLVMALKISEEKRKKLMILCSSENRETVRKISKQIFS